jgi:gliding motility-associated-like protein
LNALGDTICVGESINLNAPNGYAAYRWLPMNDTSQSITVTPTETTIYTLELTAFNGCVSVYDIPVIVTDYPDVSFTYEPDNCDFPVSFTETGVVNVGALYSQWDFGAIADPPTSNESNPLSLFPGPGTYPVKLIQTTAGGCVDSTIQDITVPNCFFQFRMEGDTICANECFTFEVEKYHGIPPFQYQWSTGAADSTITVCPSETTIYTLTVTDNVGDSFTDSVQVTVSPVVVFDPIVQNITCYGANDGRINPNPIGFGPFTPIWSNDSTTMNLDSLTAGDYTLNLVDNFGCPSAETFTIVEPDTINAEFNLVMPICNSNSGSIEIINVTGGTPSFRNGIGNGIFVPENLFENLAVGNYNITIRDTNNCQKVFPILLQNLTDPQAIEFTINNASCGESNGVLQITGVVGGVSPFSYSFENSPSEPIVTFPIEITDLEGINYTVRITDSNNCFIDSTVSLLQTGAPESIIAQLDETTCALANGQITISLVGGIEPIQYSLNSGAFVSNNVFDGLAAGIYQIAIRDSNDCTLEREVEIEPSEGVTVDIEVLSTVVCFGDTSGSLAAEVEGGTAPFDYSWSNGNNGDEIYNLSAGEYVVTITDDVGCIATASYIFEIAQPLEVDIIGEDFVCRGLPISLEAVVTGNHSSLIYNWQGLTSALPTITFNSDTSFTVQIIVENEFGCQDTASKFILVRESPQGEILVDISESCEPTCVNYNVNVFSSEPIQNYLWTAENIAPSVESFFKTCYEVSGVYGVTLSMTDIYGCNVVLNGDSLFQFYPVPIADFVSDPTKTNILKPEIHFYQESVNADFSFWNFGDGNFSDEFEPIHVYQDTGKFEICLLITTINNCRDSVCDVIKIDPFPTYYAPNIFTPNKDGLNDVFKLYFTYVVDYHLEIYNRWGELIFVSDDPNQGWDGTKNGKLVQSDTYVWKASFVDVLREPRLIYGRVTLVK